MQDCHRLYGLVQVLPAFVAVFEQLSADVDAKDRDETIDAILLEPMRRAVVNFDAYCSLIESAIDMAHFEANGEYRILPTFDENLQDLDRELRDVVDDMRVQMAQVSEAAKVDIRLESVPTVGFVFRVSMKVCKMFDCNDDD